MPTPSQQTLRSLAARHNLYVGTAVEMSALDDATHPQYRSLVASQFSTVTPENVMMADAYNYSALCRHACPTGTACRSPCGALPTGTPGVPGWFTNPPDGLATLYDVNYQPKLAYNPVRADLAFSGPPLLLPRIPQKPRG